MQDICIEQVDISKKEVLDEICRYLMPHETQALFLLGNFQSNLQPAVIHTARRAEALIGVCGFFPTFQSATIFSESEEASRMFGKLLADNNQCNVLLGMTSMVKPAYDEFLKIGREAIRNPETNFFEISLDTFQPVPPPRGVIRRATKSDVDALVLLLRYIHDIPQELHITEEDRAKVLASPITFCCEVDGTIVSVASSNGLAFHAFQILGVATHPNYRRQGFAQAACSHLMCFMRSLGAQKAVLFTPPDNIAATKCYLNLGFKVTNTFYVALFSPLQSYLDP